MHLLALVKRQRGSWHGGEDVTTILVARNEEKLKKLVNEFGGETKYLIYDLTDVEHIESCFIKCREWGIKLDGLIHCAGIGENMPIRLIQTEHIKKMYQIHPMAFIELGKYFSKRKYSNDGSSIVVMSSMVAYEMEKGMAAYASSKAAVNAVVKVMAKEMADRRIRVNGVAPAFVATPMIKRRHGYVGKRRKQSSEIWSDSSQTGCGSDWIFDVGTGKDTLQVKLYPFQQNDLLRGFV